MQSRILIHIVSWPMHHDMYRIVTLLVIHSTCKYSKDLYCYRYFLFLINMSINIVISHIMHAAFAYCAQYTLQIIYCSSSASSMVACHFKTSVFI